MPIVDDSVCEEIYNSDNIADMETTLCAYVPREGSSLCRGADPGSPIVVSDRQEDGRIRHTLLGVFAWGGKDCADTAVNYGRVSSGMDWIEETVCQDSNESFCNVNPIFPTSSPTKSPKSSKSPKKKPKSVKRFKKSSSGKDSKSSKQMKSKSSKKGLIRKASKKNSS